MAASVLSVSHCSTHFVIFFNVSKFHSPSPPYYYYCINYLTVTLHKRHGIVVWSRLGEGFSFCDDQFVDGDITVFVVFKEFYCLYVFVLPDFTGFRMVVVLIVNGILAFVGLQHRFRSYTDQG